MHTQNHSTQLHRTVRFSINPDGSTQGDNNFVSTPAFRGLARFYEITIGVLGVPDNDTGYLIGIQDLDTLVRSQVVPIIADTCDNAPTTNPLTLMPALWLAAAAESPHPLALLRWTLTPYYHLDMTPETHQTNRALFRQSFEFAAAHRLHSPKLSDEQNAAFFGKCNNPSGHGHNYRFEPTFAVSLDHSEGIDVQQLIQNAVNEAIIAPLDHTFLNTDSPWFDQASGGIIPSVEHIAKVCFEQLLQRLEKNEHGIELVQMQVWETEKTSAIYPA
jgi:6-pyruvoyltetrahydropterin/6-carboxytetrahydropterin synthase